MRRFFYLFYILVPAILLSGCVVFPYVYNTPTATATQIIEPAEPSPIATTIEITPEAISTTTATPDSLDDLSKFVPQDGTPFYLPSFTQPKAGCDWSGVAGQVFLEDGLEALGLLIVAGNTLESEPKLLSAVTGESPAYGLGGFEIQLADKTIDASQSYWVQVFSQEGQALSEKIFFDTYDDCEKNLVLINFVPYDSHTTPKTGLMAEPTPTLEAYP